MGPEVAINSACAQCQRVVLATWLGVALYLWVLSALIDSHEATAAANHKALAGGDNGLHTHWHGASEDGRGALEAQLGLQDEAAIISDRVLKDVDVASVCHHQQARLLIATGGSLGALCWCSTATLQARASKPHMVHKVPAARPFRLR